ncbi:hypothetical protein GNP59_04655 [Aliivibrio fischeri]|nr:hypothetical protein [Aliivibrio fischeri]MUL13996.1 hypothetical protein [Aliivibrio fischeri]
MSKSQRLEMSIEKVINNGYCIGCGACEYVNSDAIEVKIVDGIYKANITHADNLKEVSNKVCPFSESSKNEDELVQKKPDFINSHELGSYKEIYTGFVSDNDKREKSSSGGLTSWVLEKLIDNKEVDEVIHVVGNSNGGFEFATTCNVKEIFNGKKSKYYPVSLNAILKQLDENKKYAITGVPCFIKSIRLMQEEGYLGNIKFALALFCGHFKHTYFSEMLSWELGVKPYEIKSFDFRKKIKGYGASDYFVQVENESGTKLGRVNEMFGTNWAHGLFKPKACDFCDDICGELSDATFGDAWLSEYANEWLGTNIAIIRNDIIAKIINKGHADGDIKLKTISEADVIKSQAANYRHRRGGIIARHKQLNGIEWHPVKRMELCYKYHDEDRDELYKLRWNLSKKSIQLFKKAKQSNNYIWFKLPMFIELFKYELKVNGVSSTIKTILSKKIAKIIRLSGIRKFLKK